MYSNTVNNDFDDMSFIVFESPKEQRAFADRLSKEGAQTFENKQFTTALYSALPFYSGGLAIWRWYNGRWNYIIDELKKANVDNINFED